MVSSPGHCLDPDTKLKLPLLVLAVWLAALTAYVSWFDYAAVTAIVHPTSDAAGHLRFAVSGYSNMVYPFTYVGVGVSLFGCAYLIFRQERLGRGRVVAALIALGVANIASVGMVNIYEQVFVALNVQSPNGPVVWSFWVQYYWGSASGAAATVTGMVIVLTVLPWASGRNWPGVLLCGGVFAVGSLVWFLNGYGAPPSGDALDYWMNATTRVASQLMLVAAVAPRDVVRELAYRVRRTWHQDSPGAAPSEPAAES
jgi:hypothetical protein